MSDEIYSDGKRYVASRVAAREFARSREYLMTLCRKGEVAGKRVGRDWYIQHASLVGFIENQKKALESHYGELSRKLSTDRAAMSGIRVPAAPSAPAAVVGTSRLIKRLRIASAVLACVLVVATGARFTAVQTHDPNLASAFTPFAALVERVKDFFFGEPHDVQIAVTPPDEHKEIVQTVNNNTNTYNTTNNNYVTNTYHTKEEIISQGVSEDIVDSKISQATDYFKTVLARIGTQPTGLPSSGGFANVIAMTQRIDRLANATIENSNWTGGAISGASITGTSLAVSGTATSTFSGGIEITGGCVSVNGACVGAGGGSANPAGSDTQVQFNDGGAFAGSADFTFSTSSNRLTVTNISATNSSSTHSTSTTLFAEQASSTNLFAQNATSSTLFSTLGRFTSLFADAFETAVATITDLTTTELVATNATTTNFVATNATTTNLAATNAAVTALTATNATSTNFFATSASSTNQYSTYASTSVLTVNRICLTGDTCRTTWPLGGGGGSVAWGDVTGTLGNQTDLQDALDTKLAVTALDTLGEAEILWGSINVITLTEIDTSSELAALLSDETGSGALVFGTSPILTTPNLGTPSTLVGTNITGAAAAFSIGGNAGTATALQTARNINGIAFDGSADITITAASSTLLANNNTFSGNTALTNATSTNLFSATASSTNQYSTYASTSIFTVNQICFTGDTCRTTWPSGGGGGASAWGDITGTLSDQTDLQAALNARLTLTDWYATTTLPNLTTLSNLASVGTITSGTWSGLFGAISGANLLNLTAANIAAGTAAIDISGNAATVTNGVYTTTFNGLFDTRLGGASTTIRGMLSASSPLLYNASTGDFSIQVANASQNGYLASADWSIFNNRVATTSIDTLAELETLWGAINVLTETEIDTSAELLALMTDETGTGNLVFSDSPILTGTLTAAAAIFSGSVGIGTTSPYRKLSVTDAVSSAQLAVSYDTTRVSNFLTDASGDLVIDPSGNDAFMNDDNLWVCTGGSCPAGAPSGTGNVIVENRLGVGVAVPDDGVTTNDDFRLAGTDNRLIGSLANGVAYSLGSSGGSAIRFYDDGTGDDLISFETNDTGSSHNTRMTITGAGRVGIGTTSPAQQLGVAGQIFVGAGGAAGMGTATSTFYGDIKIIGKLDVSTIDPVYTVDNIKFATYGHSTIGIKEETTAVVQLTNKDASGKYAHTIDFTKEKSGSDLWLFYQVTDMGKSWGNLVVSLTPAFDGRVFYEKHADEKKLVIYSDKPGEVSLRLIASRYDFAKWNNLRPDQDGDTEGTHIISSKPGSAPASLQTAAAASIE